MQKFNTPNKNASASARQRGKSTAMDSSIQGNDYNDSTLPNIHQGRSSNTPLTKKPSGMSNGMFSSKLARPGNDSNVNS